MRVDRKLTREGWERDKDYLFVHTAGQPGDSRAGSTDWRLSEMAERLTSPRKDLLSAGSSGEFLCPWFGPEIRELVPDQQPAISPQDAAGFRCPQMPVGDVVYDGGRAK